jgi:WD40 repeat protein
LIFAPENGIAQGTFANRTQAWAEFLLGGQRDWGSCHGTLESHTGEVLTITFSPNGQLLAFASSSASAHEVSEENYISIWDVSAGICSSTWVGHKRHITSLEFSCDGSLLASSSLGGTIKIWNTGTWSHKATLVGHTGAVTTLAWSQDRLVIATGSKDMTVKLWDTDKGECYATLEFAHALYDVSNLAISPDRRLVVSIHGKSAIRIWDTTTMVCCKVIYEHVPIDAIHFSSDGRALAVAFTDSYNRDNNVRLYDIEADQYSNSFYTGRRTRFIAFSSRADDVAFLDNEIVRVWNYRTGLCHTRLEGCTEFGNLIAISPDDAFVATTLAGRFIKIWNMAAVPESDIRDEDKADSFLISEGDAVRAIIASPNGKLFASHHRHFIRVWDSAAAACVYTLNCASAQWNPHLEFSPSGLILAFESGTYDSDDGDRMEIRLLNIKTWSDCAFFVCKHRVRAVQFSQDGDLLVSQSADGSVQLWDIAQGLCIGTQKSDYCLHATVCLSPNNNMVAVVSEDRKVGLWDVTTGLSESLAGHTENIVRLEFSPNSQLLASSSLDKTVRLWDVGTASCRSILTASISPIDTRVAFSPDSKMLVSWNVEPYIRLWDTQNGQCLHTFDRIGLRDGGNFLRNVSNMKFSPCGTYIQTNAGDLPIPVSILDRTSLDVQRLPVIFVGNRWIYMEGIPTLWLPSEYRPSKIHISGTTVFLAFRNGKIIMLRLDLDILKRTEPRLFQPTHIQEGTNFWER